MDGTKAIFGIESFNVSLLHGGHLSARSPRWWVLPASVKGHRSVSSTFVETGRHNLGFEPKVSVIALRSFSRSRKGSANRGRVPPIRATWKSAFLGQSRCNLP